MSLFTARSSNQSGSAEPSQFGPFYLHELINSGGMADIWLATNQRGEVFALRRLHDRLRYSFVAKRRFLSGCGILSKIHDHDHVIGYCGHGKINRILYLLMEYVEGTNLKVLFNRNDPLLQKNLREILLDMAIGLEHVHDSGYMHLDFKPENILVTHNASVRLVDFDLARPRLAKPKRLGKYPGTPVYMAPEQLSRQPVDHRADIFAFGVAAYELFTSKRPFIGDSAEEVIRKQMDSSHGFTSPRRHNPQLSAALEKVILKCLERDPDKRYPFMSVLIRDLQAAP